MPTCSAVVSHVNSKRLPINTTIQFILNNKVDTSTVVSSVTNTSLSSTNILTEGAILTFLGSDGLTTNGVSTVRGQSKLYARSVTETTDSNFSFISPGVHDVTSGYDSTNDDRAQKRLTKHKRGGQCSRFVHTSRGVLATPD